MKPFLPAIIWAIVVLVLSVGPGVQLPKSFLSPDKLGHFVAYGLLNWLVIWGLSKSNKLTSNIAIMATCLVIAYGIALEFVQGAFFPNRYFELADMLANTIGAVLGYLAFKLFSKRRQPNNTPPTVD